MAHRPSYFASLLSSFSLFAFAALPACTAEIAAPSNDTEAAVASSSSALESPPPADVEWRKTDPKWPVPYLPDCPTCACPECGVVEGSSLVVTLPPAWQIGSSLRVQVYEPVRATGDSSKVRADAIGFPSNPFIKVLADVEFTAPESTSIAGQPAKPRRITLPNAPASLASLASGSTVGLYTTYFVTDPGYPQAL
jgi:hypothetical protein